MSASPGWRALGAQSRRTRALLTVHALVGLAVALSRAADKRASVA